MKHVELGLLHHTFKIISEYGALGGRIAKEQTGLIELVESDLERFSLSKKEIENYIKKKGCNYENPNLERFFFVTKNSKLNIKEFKNKLSFLKGNKEKGKRYFYKKYQGKLYHFFVYTENKEEYDKVYNYFIKKEDLQVIEGKRILETIMK